MQPSVNECATLRLCPCFEVDSFGAAHVGFEAAKKDVRIHGVNATYPVRPHKRISVFTLDWRAPQVARILLFSTDRCGDFHRISVYDHVGRSAGRD